VAENSKNILTQKQRYVNFVAKRLIIFATLNGQWLIYHHQGPSRELWKFYTYADPDTAVARAVKLDLMKKEEIPDDILQKIAPRFDLFRYHDEP
jgi:hypothetical protein